LKKNSSGPGGRSSAGRSGGKSGGKFGSRPGSGSKRRTFGKSRSIRYRIGKEDKIEYKNFPLLQRFLTDRGKIVARRLNGLTAKQQRDLTSSIKYARYMGLLPTGGSSNQ